MGGRWHSHQEMEFTIFTRGEDTRYVCDSVVLELAKPGVPAKFIAYEMPADFVQDLKDDIAAIRAADSEMDSDDQEDVASTAAVGRLIKSGMAEVTQLDAIMNNK